MNGLTNRFKFGRPFRFGFLVALAFNWIPRILTGSYGFFLYDWVGDRIAGGLLVYASLGALLFGLIGGALAVFGHQPVQDSEETGTSATGTSGRVYLESISGAVVEVFLVEGLVLGLVYLTLGFNVL